MCTKNGMREARQFGALTGPHVGSQLSISAQGPFPSVEATGHFPSASAHRIALEAPDLLLQRPSDPRCAAKKEPVKVAMDRRSLARAVIP